MYAALNRKGQIAAVFTHYSDVVIFIDADNGRHGYERVDEPGLDEVLREWMGRPKVDDERR